MLKNLTIYRLGPGWTPHGEALELGLANAHFVPCAATEPLSLGWVPPRGVAHGPLVESVGGQWLMRLTVEQRLLPASVVQQRLLEQVARIEQDTGRKPGRRQRTELKEQIVHALLPRAFAKQATVTVWLDPRHRLLVLDATAAARIDQALSALVDAVPELAARPIQTAMAPAAAMTAWLRSGEPPAGFAIERECELKAGDATGAVVRYLQHPLDADEIGPHLEAGKLPTRLALNWQGRVAFVLTAALQLRRIAFLDGVFDATGEAREEGGFDADVALMTGELGRLIPDLIEALGGERERGAEPLAA